MRLTWLISQFHMMEEAIPSARLGQHFINLCIEDSSTPIMQELWNAKEVRALEIISDIMEQYQWKANFLPVHSVLVYLGDRGWEYKRLPYALEEPESDA
ncbi:hypothetical protein VPHD418_0077 [Vibrio phage D418]